MPSPWTREDTRPVFKDRWISLRADRCRRPDGTLIEPYYVIEDPDFVHTIPVLPDGRLVLVSQYRHAVNDVCLELPGGVLDPGEEPIAGARRELREETGVTGGAWTFLHRYYPNPARNANRFHLFVARNVSLPARQSLDPTEDIAVHLCTVAEVDEAIRAGRFSQAFHLAAYLLWRTGVVPETPVA